MPLGTSPIVWGCPRGGAGRCICRLLLKDASASPLSPRSRGTTYFFLLFIGFPKLDAAHVSSQFDTTRYFVENLGGIPHQPCLVVTRY